MRTPQIALLTILAWTVQGALAHTELAETVPADRAVVGSAPEEVQLRFSEPVRLTALSVQKDGAGKQSLGPLRADTAAHFAVALPALGDGHYIVSWRALSEDTHVMTGEFMFAVGEAGGHDEHMNHAVEHAEAESHEHHDDHDGAH